MATSVRLSASEAWGVLTAAHTGILTSLRRDGAPISLPVWFVIADRRIYVSGLAHTKKFARIRHDGRVAFLVESGARWAELVAVHVNGMARPVEDAELLARVAALMADKYAPFRTPHEQMPAATRSHYETAPATIEIIPDGRILSWDNSRLDPRHP